MILPDDNDYFEKPKDSIAIITLNGKKINFHKDLAINDDLDCKKEVN